MCTVVFKKLTELSDNSSFNLRFDCFALKIFCQSLTDLLIIFEFLIDHGFREARRNTIRLICRKGMRQRLLVLLQVPMVPKLKGLGEL